MLHGEKDNTSVKVEFNNGAGDRNWKVQWLGLGLLYKS